MKREFEMDLGFSDGIDGFALPPPLIPAGYDEFGFPALLYSCINDPVELRSLLQLLKPQQVMMSAGSDSFNYLMYGVSPPIPSPETMAVLANANAFPSSFTRSSYGYGYGGGDFEPMMKIPRQDLSLSTHFTPHHLHHHQFISCSSNGVFGYGGGEFEPSNVFSGDFGFDFNSLPNLRSFETQPVSLVSDFGFQPQQGFDISPRLHSFLEKSIEIEPNQQLQSYSNKALAMAVESNTETRSPEFQLISPITLLGFKQPPQIEESKSNHQATSHRRRQSKATEAKQKTEMSRSSKLAKQRRQIKSEKLQNLRKLMPWNTKMDTTTMLEEAHKYVKFLQAQVSVLLSMPLHDDGGDMNPSAAAAPPLLARLSRQEAMEKVVNSPAAQTLLYSSGFCVCTSEQFDHVRRVIQRKPLLEQMFISSASSLFRS